MESTSEVALAVQKTPRLALQVALSKLSDPIGLKASPSRVIVKPSVYDPSLVGNTDREMLQAVVDIFRSVARIAVVEVCTVFGINRIQR